MTLPPVVPKYRSALDFDTEADLRQALAVSEDHPAASTDWYIIPTATTSKSNPSTSSAAAEHQQDVEHAIESEVQRLKALVLLAALGDVTARRDDALDRLTEEVRQNLNVAWACVSLVDLGRQFFKSIAEGKDKLQVFETSRKDAFCAHTIQLEQQCCDLLVVPDALLDARFRENPLVTGPPYVRFYAGAPLVDSHGFKIGALCVLDTEPGIVLTEAQEQELKTKASNVVQLLTERRDLLQTVRKRSSSIIASSPVANTPTVDSTNVSVVPDKKAGCSPSCTDSMSTLSPTSTLAPVKFTTSKDVEQFAASMESNNNSSIGKRSRANSPERSSDIIRNPQPQQLLLLPSPKTGNIDPDEFLVQLVGALHPGVQLRIKPALELEAFFPFISEEQMARYSVEVVKMARANDVVALKNFHAEHGRDALDCFNRFGEGLLNMACRRGFKEMVDFLLSPAVALDVRVRDDYGRTPLHDACWNPEPQLEICAWIMQKDPSLFLVADKRGFTPFQYARKSDWHIWRQFLVDNSDHLQALTLPEITTKFS